MKNMTADHECAGCGGSGVKSSVSNWGQGNVQVLDHCPVCLGSGRISDVMPVADALADAETLHGYRGLVLPRQALRTALSLGFAASIYIRSDEQDLMMGQDPISCAKYAARAAFRAVPGLRG